MDTHHKIQLLVGLLTSVATIVAAVIAAVITANLQAEETATEVAGTKATETAQIIVEQKIEELAPRLQLFPPVDTYIPKKQQLGEWQACVLVTAGESHHHQACTCIIEPSSKSSKEWQLRVNLDPTVKGSCSCRAACFNGLTQQESSV